MATRVLETTFAGVLQSEFNVFLLFVTEPSEAGRRPGCSFYLYFGGQQGNRGILRKRVTKLGPRCPYPWRDYHWKSQQYTPEVWSENVHHPAVHHPHCWAEIPGEAFSPDLKQNSKGSLWWSEYKMTLIRLSKVCWSILSWRSYLCSIAFSSWKDSRCVHRGWKCNYKCAGCYRIPLYSV